MTRDEIVAASANRAIAIQFIPWEIDECGLSVEYANGRKAAFPIKFTSGDQGRNEEKEAHPSRERCGWCHEYSAISFFVPNEIWDQSVPERFRETISCLRCFARMADERLVEWDREILFLPKSLYRHLKDIHRTY